MLRKFYNLIKSAYVSLTNDDSSTYPTTQASYKGKAANFVRLSPYGLDSNPPQGAFVLLFSAYGQESNKFGIPSDMTRRLSGLKEGEVAIYNTLTQSRIHLKENGSIDIVAQDDIRVTASGSVTISAENVVINGDTVKINGIAWDTHVHTDPQGGDTGPPKDPV